MTRFERAAAIARARWHLRGCTIGARVHASGRVHVVAEGRVRIGDGVHFVAGLVPTSIVCAGGGEVILGAEGVLNYGASIRAARSIRIGARCMIASYVFIRDADGARVAPVIIGDDVWLAHGAMIEPGVTIGDGAVVSAGSVVCEDVPARHLAIGNPAKAMPIAAMAQGK